MILKYTIILIAKNNEFNFLLNNDRYNIILFDNIEKAKLYYQENYFNIDLIIDVINLKIKTSFINDAIHIIHNLDEKNIIDKIEKIIQIDIKELDFNKSLALSMLDNNEKLYYKSVQNYYEQFNNSTDILINYLNLKDYQTIREYVHRIKGVSLYMGSLRLYEITKNLEQKIANNNFVRDDIYQFINYHHRILLYIKELLKNV